jgi:GTP-binding protein EngB required for normal cell division
VVVKSTQVQHPAAGCDGMRIEVGPCNACLWLCLSGQFVVAERSCCWLSLASARYLRPLRSPHNKPHHGLGIESFRLPSLPTTFFVRHAHHRPLKPLTHLVMSEDSSSGTGKRPVRDTDRERDYFADQQHPPQYMTVGSGSTSEHAARLTQLLEEDSGYGGSIIDGDASATSWHPGLGQDEFTPSHTPVFSNGGSAGDSERRLVASHIHQMYYNQNRKTLARAISRTSEVLRELQTMNATWPAHYPSVQRAEPIANDSPKSDMRPTFKNAISTLDIASSDMSPPRPAQPRRAETSIGEHSSLSESSSSAQKRPAPEPRLVTPQLAQDFSVLKLDLKMGHLSQSELVHSLEKSSISALLDGQISKTIRHLFSLRERIEDTASKVLVTGDLNAGKSTFCNALLRRKLLPEDQQPCTSIFCVVLDVRENAGVEEVHAVPNGTKYNREDERTYSVFPLTDLEKIVVDNDKWAQCMIYIKEIRSVDKSLLNNGVVDIALIDAPGLNMDSVITTANYAKQEEIDVVVFVVSAANHFTQSAKEFVFNAAREKAYIFMVVNGFDNIKDQQRCQDMILKQVQQLSPATWKEASELVHFVSSNAVPTAPSDFVTGSGGGSGGSGSGSGGDPGDGGDDDPSDKGKGKDKEKVRDFEELEASLRRFVLEKRARSKLAPAKTYLMNLLGDLDSLATVNRDVAQSEIDRVGKELNTLEPELEKSKHASVDAGESTDREIEDTVTDVYNHTRETLGITIDEIYKHDFDIEYPGLLGAYQYAEDLKHAMLDTVSDTVGFCEQYARDKTVTGVNAIKNLGLLHLGNGFPDFHYRPENMFRKRRDVLARQVDVEVEFFDFFDLTSLWERQEKVGTAGMAVTVAGVVGGRMMGGLGWIDGALSAVKIVGVRKLVVPGAIAAGAHWKQKLNF